MRSMASGFVRTELTDVGIAQFMVSDLYLRQIVDSSESSMK
jgi:hypothetical protein